MVKVLVLTATGKQGGATARALLSQQHTVRAYVRDASSPKAQALAALGAELVEGGDFEKDVAALDRALAGGIEAVFFVSTPSFTDPEAEVRGAKNIVEAAKRAGTVTHVVYSTVSGAARYRELKGWDSSPFFANYWISKTKGEDLVRTGGFAHHTILRPTEFMSNYTDAATATFQIPDLIKTGIQRTAIPADAPITVVAVPDIARVAAAAISDPTNGFAGGRRELDVAGQRLTMGELITRLGEVAGKKLSVHTYPPEEAAALAKANPVVAGQVARIELEKEAVVEDFGLGFRTWGDHLAEHRDEIVELYKNVP